MQTRTLRKTLIGLAVGLTVGAGALAQDNFYEDKTVQLIVGYSAGGGYDRYGRTVARHIGKHIPGNPDVVVRNVPGAGSLVAMNQMANTFPKDGTVFGTVSRGLPFEPLFGNDQARFDPVGVNWLGSVASEVSLCVASTDADVQEWQDLYDTPLLVGATGSGGDSNVFPRVLASTLDFQMNVVAGYPGSSDIVLAFERGEVESICSWSYSSNKETRDSLIENGDARILFQMALRKHPDLPDVPLVLEFADTERQRQALTLLFARQSMGRPFVAPPGMPEERLQILREALEATTRDPEFLEEAANQNLEIDFVSGEEIQDLIREAYSYPDDVVNIIRESM